MIIRASIEGDQQIVRRLRGLKDKDLRKGFKKLGDKLVSFYSGEVFTSEGSAIGMPWVGGPRYNRLQRSGNMRSNFHAIATAKSLEIENTTPYFKYHQSNKPRTKLPRRVMLKLDTQRKQWVVKALQAEFEDELQKRI